MSETLHIIVPTIRFTPVARNIMKHLIGVVEETDDVHFTIADGQENEEKRDWILRRTEGIAKEGKFTYIGLKDGMQRALLASARETDWLVSITDDDPYSVNLINVYQSAIQGVEQGVVAFSPYAYISDAGSRLNIFPLQDITEESQKLRLDSLYRQMPLNGLMVWCLLRRQLFVDWLQFVRQKLLWPSYADQILVSYLAMRGKILNAREGCFIGRDDRDWYDPAKAIVMDSSSYANKFSTLFHEIFWISDLVAFLSQKGLEEEAWPSVTFRATSLLIGGASVFENRMRVLEIEKSIHTQNAQSLVNDLARYAHSLATAPVSEHGRFLNQVREIAQQLRINDLVL